VGGSESFIEIEMLYVVSFGASDTGSEGGWGRTGGNYGAILYRFWDIIAYFQKAKEVTWKWPR